MSSNRTKSGTPAFWAELYHAEQQAAEYERQANILRAQLAAEKAEPTAQIQQEQEKARHEPRKLKREIDKAGERANGERKQRDKDEKQKAQAKEEDNSRHAKSDKLQEEKKQVQGQDEWVEQATSHRHGQKAAIQAEKQKAKLQRQVKARVLSVLQDPAYHLALPPQPPT